MAFIQPAQVPPFPFEFVTWGETQDRKLSFVKGHLTRLGAKRAYLKLTRHNPDNLKAYGWAVIDPSDRQHGMNP